MNPRGRQKISCAVIGAGAFGGHYIRILRDNPRTILAAVVNPSGEERALTLSQETKRYKEAGDALSNPSIDAVVIATPLSTHAKLATAALRSGKHVLLEKPLALNMAEAEMIQAAVKNSGKIFMLGHQYLYNDDVAALKAELDAGRIGKVRVVHGEQLYTGPMRFDVGCFREAGTHELALIDHLFDAGAPISVEASGVDLVGGAREDFAAATIHYQNGLFAHLVISSYSPIKSRRMLFSGDNGMATFDDLAPEHKISFLLRPFPNKEKSAQTKTLPIPAGETYVPKVGQRREPLAQEIEHFLDCIETGKAPRSDITHAMRVEEALKLVSQAMRMA